MLESFSDMNIIDDAFSESFYVLCRRFPITFNANFAIYNFYQEGFSDFREVYSEVRVFTLRGDLV